MLTEHNRQWETVNTYTHDTKYRFYNILLWESKCLWGHLVQQTRCLGFLICEMKLWMRKTNIKWQFRSHMSVSCLYSTISPGRVWIREHGGNNFGYRVKIPGFQSLSLDPTLLLTMWAGAPNSYKMLVLVLFCFRPQTPVRIWWKLKILSPRKRHTFTYLQTFVYM